MAAQSAICRPLLPCASSTSSHALRTHPGNARAAFFGISRPFCSHKHRLHQQRWSASIIRNGLFDFLTPGGSAGASDELVSEILDAARGTNGGSKASEETREELEKLAQQLSKYRPRAPTKSPLFTGTWKVLYTSNPRAPGGPVLRSAPGQALFAGQQLRQIIEQPDIFKNEVAFKTLGLFPGTAVQNGRWRAIDGNRYVVDLQPASLKVGGGVGADDQTEAVSRSFEVLYLDESARIVRFLPDADSDSESQLFVFERDSAEQYEEEEEGEEGDLGEEEEEEKPALSFFGGRGQQSLATQAERSYKAQQPGPKRGTRQIKQQPARAKPEMSEEDKKREAVRAQLEKIAQEYKDAQDQARSAAQQLKDLEKEASQKQREARPALEKVKSAEETVEAAEDQVRRAEEFANSVDEELKAAMEQLRSLERAGR